MKYQIGTLESVPLFVASTSQILAAVAEERARPGKDMFSAYRGATYDLGAALQSESFANEVNYCMSYIAMFTRQASCNQSFRKHDAEGLGKGEDAEGGRFTVGHINATAMFAAIALMQFPRAYFHGGFNVGLPRREERWAFDAGIGAKLPARGRTMPPGFEEFMSGRNRFATFRWPDQS